MPDERDITVPVYLITGFLESGKTTFLNHTLHQEYFQTDEATLVISCENGEIPYDKDLFNDIKTEFVSIRKKDQFTEERLQELDEEFYPERVMIEYNPLWSVKALEQMELPEGWGIIQQIVIVDGSTFQLYMNNMRPIFMEMIQNAEMVIFNRCSADLPLASFRRSVKVVNPGADTVFEDESGGIQEVFGGAMPYDLDADVIEIEDIDFGIFYVDMIDHRERYMGRTVKFKGRVAIDPETEEGTFGIGRTAMTCCADDTLFIGYVCRSKNAHRLKNRDWIVLTAKVGWGNAKAYKGAGPILQASVIKVSQAPENEWVYFN